MSSAGPAERRDPTCPSWPRQAEPPQLRLSTRLESSVRGQGRQGPRTRMLPPGDAPQRRMRTTPQLCHQARRSQAPACRSSSCRVCHGRCWEEAHLPERARGKTPGAATHSPQRPHPGTVTGLPDPLGFTPRSRPCRRTAGLQTPTEEGVAQLKPVPTCSSRPGEALGSSLHPWSHSALKRDLLLKQHLDFEPDPRGL